MPDALEFPRMLGTVVPLVRSERLSGLRGSVIGELVAVAFGHRRSFRWRGSRRRAGLVPGLAAVIGALNDLAKPSASLRCVQPVRVNRRSLDVIHLPTCEVGAAHVPLFALAVGCKYECAFACAHQYSYFTHAMLLCEIRGIVKTVQTKWSEARRETAKWNHGAQLVIAEVNPRPYQHAGKNRKQDPRAANPNHGCGCATEISG